MHWIAFNGSPRGPKSNTHVMLEQMRSGMERAAEVTWQEEFLNNPNRHAEIADSSKKADALILAYPLYTDSMPGIVVHFLETLLAAEREGGVGQLVEKPVFFLVHSGFPDGIHTKHQEHTHRRIAEELRWRYLGTLRKPGSEGVRLMPPAMNRKLFSVLQEIGRRLALGAELDSELMGRLAPREHYGPMKRVMFRIMAMVGITNIYWNQMLKKHEAYAIRFQAPYGPPYKP